MPDEQTAPTLAEVLTHDHADTCATALSPTEGYPCSCWKADLRAALARMSTPAVREAAARAMYDLEWQGAFATWDREVDTIRDIWREHADAALAVVMREVQG